ncbi:MAG: NHLP family bacteriocin export ABC transporter peptidase/permease/ATPase subunit [Eubacterium sp.]|nr:NHLP family bacteriocin export ABC transporter peptidase/permease/ATPase subunit [Eubacterium sp.]
MKSNYVKTPTVYQMEAVECGAASLSMVLAYYGKKVSLEQMRIETGVSRDGCNALNILKAAGKFGLKCSGHRLEPERLKEIKCPCIIHWNLNHFVVFEGIKRDYVYINDPAVGRRRLTMDELDKSFTGIVLTFEPTDKFEKGEEGSSLFKNISEGLSGWREAAAKLFCVGLLAVVPGAVFPVLLQIFIDEIFIGGNKGLFDCLAVTAVCAAVLITALNLYRGLILQKLQAKMILVSCHKFLFKLFCLPIGFFEQRYAADLAGRTENNSGITLFLTEELTEAFLNIFAALFYFVLLIIYSPLLTVIGIADTAFNIIITGISSKIRADAIIKLKQDRGKASAVLCAGINIADTLKASGTENEYVSRVLGYYAKNTMEEQRLGRLQTIINVIPKAINLISLILVITIGSMFIIKGQMTVGMLTAFSIFLICFMKPVERLTGFAGQIQAFKADAAGASDIMNYSLDPKYTDENDMFDIETKLSGEIELRNISFGYSILKEPLIKNFSFSLSSGRSIAIVGQSGCGKSTVSKIVSGLFKPWSGEILLDNMPMERVPKKVLYASISTVSQNITLFSGTVRDNLTMWNKGILEADIIKAAKDACIHDVITSKPGAYDYKLTEGASNFSAGQRQRLEIARALTTNPSVMIMDEATSALDPMIEKQIMDNIKRRGCTCIVIAHRLSAVRDCDKILVMKDGEIVDSGSHGELSAREGLYILLISNA